MAQLKNNVNLVTIAEIVLSCYEKNSPLESFFVGITGASGAGKTTLSIELQQKIQQLQPLKKVTVIHADNFIYPNAYLEVNDLMRRKGFPESFDFKLLQTCFQAIKENVFPIWTPCYSQEIKDIIPEKKIVIEKSDIYLFEGVNLFFDYETFHATNYLDFCIYLDTARHIIKERSLKRFFEAYEKSKIKPTSYFEKFAGWEVSAIRKYAETLWRAMDMELFKEHIEPYKSVANLILKSYNSD